MGDNEDLIRRINDINWFHSIPIRDGIVTPSPRQIHGKVGQVCLPADLSGKTVLDIGAWDGFFSFQAERNETDNVCFQITSVGGPGWGTKDGFNLVHEALDSKIESLDIDPMDITPERLKFGVVCSSVFSITFKTRWLVCVAASVYKNRYH